MKSQKAKVSNAGILLAGDPGVGKTSVIRLPGRSILLTYIKKLVFIK
jgi:DNA replication protein DnaC